MKNTATTTESAASSATLHSGCDIDQATTKSCMASPPAVYPA
jgi:hypothetical protein